MRLLAFLAMATVWGFTWIAARWATEAAPPVLVAGTRLVIASCAFGILCVIARIPPRIGRYRRLVAASLLVNTGCYSLLFWGVAHAPTGLSAVVNMALIPVFSMLLGAAYGQERITTRRLLSVALGAVGLAILFASRGSSGPGDGGTVALGLGAIVLATLSYAWGAVVSKPLVGAYPPLSVAFWESLIGGIALLVVSAVIEGPGLADLAALAQGRALAGLAFLVLGGSLVGFLVYLWLLREWGAFRAGLYAFVSPAVAVALGVALQGEQVGPTEILGMVVMFAATALVVRPETAVAPARR